MTRSVTARHKATFYVRLLGVQVNSVDRLGNDAPAAGNFFPMRRRTPTFLFLLLVLAGCHAREDTGGFRLGLDTVEPVARGMLQRMADRKPIALTFDDGPENLADDRSILATLAKHHAHALWLVTCKRLDPSIDPQAAEHRIALKQIVAQGHLIGNHGFSHVDLRPLGAAALHHEIVGCSELITQLTGRRPVYFRPPFGVHTPEVDRTIRANRMQLLLWANNSYDSFLADFKRHPQGFAAFVAAHPIFDVALNARSGDVLLFHDYPNTALALDGILTRLEQRHFQFVLPYANEQRD